MEAVTIKPKMDKRATLVRRQLAEMAHQMETQFGRESSLLLVGALDHVDRAMSKYARLVAGVNMGSR